MSTKKTDDRLDPNAKAVGQPPSCVSIGYRANLPCAF